MDVLVYGAGYRGWYFEALTVQRKDINILAYIDKYPAGGVVQHHPIFEPDRISSFAYDKIFVANDRSTMEIVEELKGKYGVPEEKIILANIDNHEFWLDMKKKFLSRDEDTDVRVRWLKDFAKFAKLNGMKGNVAEAGVYMAGYAHFISKYFPDKTLYLFDTFEGFDLRDLEVERSLAADSFLQGMYNNDDSFGDIKEDWREIVLAKMTNPANVIFKKGYFPETAEGLDDSFVFVDLDMDLYRPMLAGLRVFYDKLVPGGVIMLHDYFNPELAHGVQKAVADFEEERGVRLAKTSIGDESTLIIIRM